MEEQIIPSGPKKAPHWAQKKCSGCQVLSKAVTTFCNIKTSTSNVISSSHVPTPILTFETILLNIISTQYLLPTGHYLHSNWIQMGFLKVFSRLLFQLNTINYNQKRAGQLWRSSDAIWAANCAAGSCFPGLKPFLMYLEQQQTYTHTHTQCRPRCQNNNESRKKTCQETLQTESICLSSLVSNCNPCMLTVNWGVSYSVFRLGCCACLILLEICENNDMLANLEQSPIQLLNQSILHCCSQQKLKVKTGMSS